MHPECITKSHRHNTLAVRSDMDFWERHHIFANVTGISFSSNSSLTSQVTLSKQKNLKKRQIKNSFVECLVTFMVYHRFLPWFE